MKVLYVSHFGGLGGAERSLLEVMAAIREFGVSPQLLCPEGALAAAARRLSVPVMIWRGRPLTQVGGWRSYVRPMPRIVAGWLQLEHAVRTCDPALLHVNSGQAMVWCAPTVWRRRCPVVWHWRDFGGPRRFLKSMAQASAAVVVISRAMEQFAEALLGPLATRVALARNGVADLPPCDDREVENLRRSIGCTRDAPLVVMAGQSIPRKGHALLLEAVASMAARHPRMRAWLVCAQHDAASRAHTEWLRSRALALGCGQSVHITDGIDRLAPLLYAADVVVVPSLREPFGRLAVEAMLAERPVVASAVDGLTEIVDDGATGMLVPPGDPARLAAALDDVLGHRALWRERARDARRRALQSFSITRTAREVRSIYQRVLQEGPVAIS